MDNIKATRQAIEQRKKHLAELKRRKKEFDSMPEERRALFTKYGWNPYKIGKPIIRTGGVLNLK